MSYKGKLKIKRLMHSKENTLLDVIGPLIMVLLFWIFTIKLCLTLFNYLSELDFNFGENIQSETKIQVLSACFVLFIGMFTIIISVFTTGLYKVLDHLKVLWTFDGSNTDGIKTLLDQIPDLYITKLTDTAVEIQYNNKINLIEGYAFFNGQDGLPYQVFNISSRRNEEIIIIPREYVFGQNGIIELYLICDLNNKYKYVSNIKLKEDNSEIKENSTYIKHYYMKENNFKRWKKFVDNNLNT